LKEQIKDILELFVEKADKLAQEEFTQFIKEFGQQLRYMADPQQLTMSTIAPTQTMTYSFLMTYRMFVQERDGLRLIDPIKPLSSQLTDASLSPQWREQFQDVAQKIHTFLREKPPVQMQFILIDQQGNTRTEIPTRWDILDTLLYGEIAHSTKRKQLTNWLSTDFKEEVWQFLMMEFRHILAVTLSGIQYLAQYARIELTLPESR